jgi:hypothetical protein
MELDNTTRFPAALFRTIVDEHHLLAAALVRVTYALQARSAVPSDEQPWKVSSSPWESEYGPMDSDEAIYKAGTDVYVFGSAVSPGENPSTSMTVTIAVGPAHQHTLQIYGDRYWDRHNGELKATAPAPFVRIPLTFANAYGGKDVWDELAMPFPANPAGKGYIFAEETGEGKPLPNIEDPRHPIRAWNDAPEPVGTAVAGMMFGPKLPKVIRLDPSTGRIRSISPLLYNTAFPDLIVRDVRPGASVVVSGVSARGDVAFTIPPPPVELRVRFGRENGVVPALVDQIGIEPDKDRFFIGWRFPFRYRMNPMQLREARLISAN